MLHSKGNTMKVIVILFMLLALIACSGQKSIVVDTTGMTPEQIAAVEWKVKYAVALDWYHWQMMSYKTNLDMLSKEDAQAFHAKAGPLLDVAFTTLHGLRAVAYSSSPDPVEQAQAYEAFMKAKAELLRILLTLTN